MKQPVPAYFGGLVESTFEIVEATEEAPLPDGVIMRISGTLGEVDKLNRNGRIYPRPIMVREIRKAGKTLRERGMFSLSDHPSFAEPFQGSISKAAGIVVSAGFTEDDDDLRIVGEIDLVDNAAGRDVAALVRAKAKLGISQRGFGSIKVDEFKAPDGTVIANAKIVQTDYKLESWDIVIGPSADAYVSAFRETEEDPAMLTLALLQSDHPEIYAEAKAQIESELRADLDAEIETAKTEAVDAARGEWETDHAVALTLETTLAERDVEDASAWLDTVDGRIATLEAEKSDAERRAETAEAETGKANGLRSMLREKCAENPAVFVKAEALAFDDDGAPAMTTEALGRVIDATFENVAAPPADAPPAPGSGHVPPVDDPADNDDDLAEAERKTLGAINEMRSKHGLPLLDKLPESATA